MLNQSPRIASVLAGLLLLVPPALAQEQRERQSQLDVDATTSTVRLEVDLTGRLQVSGTSAERVRIEAAPHSTGDLPGCSVSIRQEGDTVEVNMPASDGCRADMDLRVEVPRRFGATILAPEAGEVVVRDLEGRVAGEASPELECQFQGFRSSMSCAGGQFDVTFSAGEFAMRARNRE